MSDQFTHTRLSEIACSWLKRPMSNRGPACQIAMIEVGGLYGGERADAWGYRWGCNGGSVLVEVKVSRSDFLVDAKKPHRNGKVLGMGAYRYYMCPEGIITLDDLPHGWGLLWVNSRGHVKLLAGHVCMLLGHNGRGAETVWAHQKNDQLELEMMSLVLSRIGDPEVMNRRLRDAEQKAQRLARYHDDFHRQEREMKVLRWKVNSMSELLDAQGGEVAAA
ncbi:TPA: adenylosuccinate synthase [Aeromonas salmonicida]|uniref:Adenylosuccinate synthase n=1 Tax=Aeromonas salmonicida subsp. salmonicida TaxID=29491 RepID=A0A8F3IUU8_AERSS|nr:adenylosuccinate synthase [Aeromonas salmonicida]MBM9522630.1 adenylosuccinate synthase [Aeromonas salmonicida subsp. salmonicida]QWY91810.1 adenylosuccinate synthase [Aeromonas salmonicida subsp. salmonicida]HDN9804021.1 adenylosuccinate synthase [Aeromonas salmonicida]HDO0961105.1 adenylosuccinate synthase [Aeromonas salmonicida]HDO0965732.1 adenylosuccinate synthase [Aeromonas salmonicida]